MFTLQFSITPWFLSSIFCCGLLFGCNNNYLIENTSAPINEELFYQKNGFKLDYDLYLPNSFTGWEPTIHNKFFYDTRQQLYVLNNLDISKTPIDNYGQRFKITSIDWQHEFGFASTNAFIEESKFGLVPNTPSIFKIKHYSVLADSKDLFFELPQGVTPTALNIKIKIITEKIPYQALLLVSYVEG